ncbi:MAG: HD domain-containing protein [Candidatus Gracilibacteria bacterium]
MENIEIIANKLNKIGKKLFIVGGYVRAKVIGIDYKGDVDLTTDATPLEMEKVLFVVAEVGKKYGTLIIKEGKEVFEITTFREDIGILNNRKPVEVKFTTDLYLDSKRRDFTINSIYFDVQNKVFIDPENGIDDLKNNIIRFVGNPNDRINEDALRILRFIRFKNAYNLSVASNNYFDILKDNIALLNNISVERIKDEFEKILLLKNNIQALKDLKQIGFFALFFPEIDILDKVAGGPKYHLEGDVWTHTLMTIGELNNIFEKGFTTYDKNGNEIIKYFENTEKITLYRTMLLHDIGKYDTYEKCDNGNSHYLNHEHIGVEKFNDIQKRFIFTNDQKDIISWLINNHLKVFKVPEMRVLKARKFMMHKYFEYLMVIGFSDYLGRIPTSQDLIIELKSFYKEFLLNLKDKKFFTGKDILEKYPDLQGYQIKEKLETLNDRILIE